VCCNNGNNGFSQLRLLLHFRGSVYPVPALFLDDKLRPSFPSLFEQIFYQILSPLWQASWRSSIVDWFESNYEEVTATECVNTNSSQWPTNYVPSVSACIGVSFPQEPLSHAGVTFQQWYRVLMSVAMYIHYQKLFKGTAPLTNRTRLALSFLENVVFIGGTSVTSTESIEWHEVFCGLYFVFHTFTMALTIVMTKYKLNHLEQSNNVLHVKDRNIRQRQQHTEKAYSLRIRLFQFWCFCLCFMVFFFATAKGSMCTVNGWYSMFAIFEWLTLWTGFSFDCLEYLDLYDVSLMLVED
jgi:hypothetical protein